MPGKIRLVLDVKELGLKAGEELFTIHDPEFVSTKGNGIYIQDPKNRVAKFWLYAFEFELIEQTPW
jgi:hypothetical protein